MEVVVRTDTAAVSHLAPNLPKLKPSTSILRKSQTCCLLLANSSISPHKISLSSNRIRKSVIVEVKKKNDKNINQEKIDNHSFAIKPDESTGIFPEAVLLKEKKVEKDGKLLPEFADADEEKLFEMLNLQLESDLNVQRMRHYEVVYLIHEKNVEEVEKVNEKVQGFLRDNKGRICRLNDWGLRRLAYKIQNAKKAHYMLMNFELEAKKINEFKEMLDKDERVIRHLVIKRDEAITEDCPPPLEFHNLQAGTDDAEDEDDDVEYYDSEDDYDDEEEELDDEDAEEYEEDDEEAELNTSATIITVADDMEHRNIKSSRNLEAEKVGR